MKRLIILLLILFGGCSTLPQTPIITLKESDAPNWVVQGQGAFIDEQGKIFYGVGSSTIPENDWSFARLKADNRARADLVKAVEFYNSSLFKDYRSDDGELSEEAMKIFTSKTMNGVLIVNHWEHPNRAEIFSLAKLDIDKVQENIKKYMKMSDGVSKHIQERARQLHRELEKQEKNKTGWSSVNEWLSFKTIDYVCFDHLPETSEQCYNQ